METQAPTRSKVLVMVLFALSCFGLLVYLWTAFGGAVPLKPNGYRFHVHFTEATQLSVQADVRISGVTVGHVVQTTPGHDVTDSEIELQGRYAPIPVDSRAILRIKTLLGETYVELTPGSPGARKLPEGGTLPDANVGHTVELDEILRAFNRPTRRDFQRWLQSWSASLRGRGQDVSATFGNAAPAAQDVDGVLAQLDSQRNAVTRLVHDSGVVFGAIGSREGAVRELIGTGDQVFRTTAADARPLTETLRILPTFLGELRPTLAVAEATAADAAPVVADLHGPAKRLRPTLVSLSGLAPDARALFRDIDPLIRLSKPALPALTAVVRNAKPLVDVLYPVGRQLAPVVEYLGLYKRETAAMWANIASDTQGVARTPGDAHPLHYVRTLIPFTNEGFVTYSHRLPSNRHNAYLAPGAMDKLASGLESLDCANESNQQIAIPSIAFPACRTQKPWTFRGLTQSFPHVQEDGG